MKNHWLDRKEEKDFLKALDETCEQAEKIEAEFQDTDFLDAFDFGVKTNRSTYDLNQAKALVSAHATDPLWLSELLGHIETLTRHASTLSTTMSVPGGDGITLQDNIIIAGGFMSEETYKNTKDYPGWKDGKIVDMDLWKGKCEKCGEYQWPMNDENTMMQGDPMCACYNSCGNLDIFYADQFVQNEELQVIDKSKHGVTQFQTTYTPVLPGTMSGSIEWVHEGFTYAGFTFNVTADGRFDNVRRMGVKDKKEMTLEELAASECTLDLYYDELYTWESSLNCQTGVLEVHWHSSEHPNKVTVSYEYNKGDF